jgi:uncharacterized protein involved in outer membrane biogenesis
LYFTEQPRARLDDDMAAFLDHIPLATPRLRRVAFWLSISLALYALAGFFLLPAVLESVIVGQGAAALNRATRIDDVSFNPFTLRLTLRGLRVESDTMGARPDTAKDAAENATENAGENPPEDRTPLLALDELSASASPASLWRMAPVITDLVLRNPAVSVVHYGDGRYSISDLIDPPGQPDGGEEHAGGPFPFALYGFKMSNATIVFDDRPRGKRHVVSQLNLSIPFTSSFEALREEFTQPTCSAVINGDPVELTGRSLPFHDTLRTEFRLGAVDVDLDKYWPYVPDVTPLRLARGRFTSDVSLNFERPDDKRIKLFLSGGGSLADVELTSPDDGTVLSVKRVDFQLDRFSLGDMRLVLGRLAVDGPAATVIRHEDETLNWQRYFPARPEDRTEKAHDPSQDMTVEIRDLAVTSGSVAWTDRAVPGGFSRTVSGLAITARGLNTGSDPADFSVSATLGGAARTVAATGQLVVSPLSASAGVTASGIALPEYAAYFAHALPLAVDSGTADASGTMRFTDTPSPELTLRDGAITLRDLRLRAPEAEDPAISTRSLAVNGIALDTTTRDLTVADILLETPAATLRMDESGQLDLVALFSEDAPDLTDQNATAATEQPGPAADPEPDWTATVDTLRVADGSFTLVDGAGRGAAMGLTGMDIHARSVSTREGAPLTCAVNATWSGGGTIRAEAGGTLVPLAATGSAALAGAGLGPVSPYLARFADMTLARGALSATMDFELDGDGVFKADGDATLSDASLEDAGGSELAGLDTLALTGVGFQSEPARLGVDAVRLDGPRALVEFDEAGRLNLLTALRMQPDAPDTTTAATGTADTPAPSAETTDGDEPDEPPFFETMRIGRVAVDNGVVRFRDASVAPAYATEVRDIRLTLTDIARTPEARPRLDLRASIDHAPLTASGVLNPVADPLYSDMAVTIGGLELPPLSPYSLRYLAHPIQSGRLYAETTIRIDNQALAADNAFFVQRLVLGPRDTRPGAPNVPVQFGLSLLRDGNGDVTLDLPIRGRLDDPNFRIGGIVFKTLAGLFTRALTSPFSILGSLFGGEKNMDHIVFAPGRSALDANAQHKLETVITALEARTGLTLEITGVSDPDADRRGLKDAMIETRLKEQKFASLPPSRRAWTTVEAMTIEPGEYEDLLYEAYKDEPDETDNRPTTFFVADRQPPEVMRKYLEDAITVTDDDLRQLERDRAEAVSAHIVGRSPALKPRVTLPDRRGQRTAKTGIPLHRADLGLR